MAIEKIQPRSVSFQSSGADFVMPMQLGQRQVEHAERVSLADAEVDAQRRRRNHPAAEAGLGDGVASVQNR